MSDAARVAAVEVLVQRTDDPDLQDIDVLDADERQRYQRITREGPRQRFLTGRNLLRLAIGSRLGIASAEVPLRVLEDGRPSCDDIGGISLSHSGDFVACALADRPLGVDVQITGTRHDTAAIAAARFLPQEREWLADQGPEAFYRLWVLKEAWLKASGRGLAGGLDSIRCEIDSQGLRMVAEGMGPIAAAQWELPGAMLAVVVPDSAMVNASISGVETTMQAATESWRSGDALHPIS